LAITLIYNEDSTVSTNISALRSPAVLQCKQRAVAAAM